VHISDSPDPGMHFDVGLIQEPRPQAATCGPGDPGTAFTGLDLDGAGNGTTTVSETLRPGTTGVWVFVERGDPHSQNPAEFYTSEFVAPVYAARCCRASSRGGGAVIPSRHERVRAGGLRAAAQAALLHRGKGAALPDR
jgi:hypothetical protein